MENQLRAVSAVSINRNIFSQNAVSFVFQSVLRAKIGRLPIHDFSDFAKDATSVVVGLARSIAHHFSPQRWFSSVPHPPIKNQAAPRPGRCPQNTHNLNKT
jgi:hypothetical protein